MRYYTCNYTKLSRWQMLRAVIYFGLGWLLAYGISSKASLAIGNRQCIVWKEWLGLFKNILNIITYLNSYIKYLFWKFWHSVTFSLHCVVAQPQFRRCHFRRLCSGTVCFSRYHIALSMSKQLTNTDAVNTYSLKV